MSYLKFHMVFNLPLVLALGTACLMWVEFDGWKWGVACVVAAVVFLCTTPWDNYAIRQGIWGFPESRLLGRWMALPYEEVAFFFIQGMHVILLLELLMLWMPDARSREVDVFAMPETFVLMGLGALVWGIAGVWGGKKIGRGSRYHYLWHLLYWTLPVIFVQWVIAWDVLLPRLELVGVATLFVGTYLSLADICAVEEGIWFFDEKQIFGIKWLGKLPVEEILFFYITSLLVAQSYLILLPEGLR